MADELKSIQQLVDVSTAVIETPTLSVNDFGIKCEKNELIWTGAVSPAAKGMYSFLAGQITTSSVIGQSVTISATTLGSIGSAAFAGVVAAAAGSGTVPVIGWAVAAMIAAYGFSRYRDAKKQQQEKERMYREIIKQQQAAIAKLKEKNAELEVMRRNVISDNKQNSMRIKELEQEVANLRDLIEILTMQRSNFEVA